MHHQPYVLCYDIADPKRLARVHRAVSKIMMQLQRSVYYAEAMPSEIDQLVARLAQIIDPKKDDIRVYAVEPLADAIMLGSFGEQGLALFDREGRPMLGGMRAKGWDIDDE